MGYLLLKPYDSLFFRDGKPFEKGTSRWLSGMNIPYPSTIYGAIFSHIIRQNPKVSDEVDKMRQEFEKLKGKKQDKLAEALESKLMGYLKIKNIYLYDKNRNAAYIPAPLDIFINEEGRIKYGEFIKEKYRCNNEIELEYLMKNPKDYDRADNYYMNILDFVRYYAKGKRRNGLLISENDIFEKSYKVGIELNETRTSEEGHLYRIDTSEFIDKGFRFLIEYEIDKDIKLTSGYIRLGGEGKLAELEVIDEEIYDIKMLNKYYENTNLENNYVKLVLTTESIFKETAFFPKLKNIDVVGIVNDKPLHIGGYDMLRKRPKPMMKANKRGCIYILEFKNAKCKSLKDIKEEIEKAVDFGKGNSYRGFNRFILSIFKGD
ncbi:type III-B CRISPR module-associated protein Cmr3 [Paramaledivibacter caminithermalis]|jgi:CRISPR-associated protein Cmr3|uniref:CRISPR-associated protein Cmr3 n=1 Tax=Paramaledivibacter caminithermalis (strain DSM 15212 / CIP 107654 / DViRD3) TaxID=1121301 RepID=A0A1M6QT84_PARC5|nr:type III-B CRISPR module-associated protein Cmr3 [Paramaledivibacter caminithermalis]SHK23416.1 CRISPR-associated protein Cmr3 [Paramaledivibacter caminithermalis DSM 15212]